MLERGKREKWSTILKEYTGSGEISARPLLKYFEPLVEWLKKERNTKQYAIGWEEDLSSYGEYLRANSFATVLMLVLITLKVTNILE